MCWHVRPLRPTAVSAGAADDDPHRRAAGIPWRPAATPLQRQAETPAGAEHQRRGQPPAYYRAASTLNADATSAGPAVLWRPSMPPLGGAAVWKEEALSAEAAQARMREPATLCRDRAEPPGPGAQALDVGCSVAVRHPRPSRNCLDTRVGSFRGRQRLGPLPPDAGRGPGARCKAAGSKPGHAATPKPKRLPSASRRSDHPAVRLP